MSMQIDSDMEEILLQLSNNRTVVQLVLEIQTLRKEIQIMRKLVPETNYMVNAPQSTLREAYISKSTVKGPF